MSEPVSRLRLSRPVIGPHADQPVFQMGPPLTDARVAVVLVHGRGGSAWDMLGLSGELQATGTSFVAPQAEGSTWYPRRFLAPPRENEPWLSSGLDLLHAIVESLEQAGLTRDRIVLLGFSQGGCLAVHFGATHATRWGGLVGLSAGLIGPPGEPWAFDGTLDGTPVFLGCSDRDPHIPETRLTESATALRNLGGDVTLKVYPGLGHTVNADEVTHVRRILRTIAQGEAA